MTIKEECVISRIGLQGYSLTLLNFEPSDRRCLTWLAIIIAEH